MGLSIPVSVTPVSPVWCCEMETGNYYEDFCLIMPVSAVSVGTNTTTTTTTTTRPFSGDTNTAHITQTLFSAAQLAQCEGGLA